MEHEDAGLADAPDALSSVVMTGKSSSGDGAYTVVARRYRPKTFDELIGQDHIAQALGKAISANRVGHAYLFTGARGVGKTSTARIFAKVLNAPDSSAPELAADIASSIDSGDDMDVIEIDGASNRGIEEIRQLRANVSVRPSRSPFKIYIIDEVHMLTNQAFNALLKTLEEPPNHVKFIFCTTDPDKIPITVLSRCQRFDFAPVKFEAIQKRLVEICASEGFEADVEALGLLARRAAGSMRDSQSLLEQVMSFSTEKITVEQVHALLGTADEGRLLALVESLIEANALQAIKLVDEATRSGSDAGQLAEQLLNYLRDLMAIAVGGGPDLLKFANPAGHAKLAELVKKWGMQSQLSAIQILDESLVRMRSSVSSITLLEVALVQICQLEHLASIPELLERLMLAPVSGRTPAATQMARPAEKKNVELNRTSAAADSRPYASSAIAAGSPRTSDQAGPSLDPPAPEAVQAAAASVEPASQRTAANSESAPRKESLPEKATVTSTGGHAVVNVAEPRVAPESSVESSAPPASAMADVSGVSPRAPAGASPESLAIWKGVVSAISGMLSDFAGLAAAVQPHGSDHWKILFPPGASRPCEYCEQAERKTTLQAELARAVGREIALTFAVMPGEAARRAVAVPQSSIRAQKLREMSEHPYVKRACEVLDGEIIRVDSPREP